MTVNKIFLKWNKTWLNYQSLQSIRRKLSSCESSGERSRRLHQTVAPDCFIAYSLIILNGLGCWLKKKTLRLSLATNEVKLLFIFILYRKPNCRGWHIFLFTLSFFGFCNTINRLTFQPLFKPEFACNMFLKRGSPSFSFRTMSHNKDFSTSITISKLYMLPSFLRYTRWYFLPSRRLTKVLRNSVID